MPYAGFQTNWKPSWESAYAVKRSEQTGSAYCSLCSVFGREDHRPDETRKRSLTTHIKFWKPPFRTDNFVRHHESQHKDKWSKYKTLGKEQKKVFLTCEVILGGVDSETGRKKQTTLTDIYSGLTVRRDFHLSKEIVNVLLKEMLHVVPSSEDELAVVDDDECPSYRQYLKSLLDDDDDVESGDDEEDGSNASNSQTSTSVSSNNTVTSSQTTQNTIDRLFKEIDDDDQKMLTQINNILQYDYVKKLVALGMSFNQIAETITHTRETLQDVRLGYCSRGKVSDICYQICGETFEIIKRVLESPQVWAFSAAFDAGNKEDVPFLDSRIRFVLDGILFDLNLAAIPVYEAHNAQNFFGKVKTLFDVVCWLWKQKLIGFGSDGASVMLGRRTGLVTRLRQELTCSAKMYQIWCPEHQIDLKAKKFIKNLLFGAFVKQLTDMTNWLRRCTSFTEINGEKCPKYAGTRWISMGPCIKFFIMKRTRIIRYMERKGRSDLIPPATWWLAARVLFLVIHEVESHLKRLQRITMTLDEQRIIMKDMVDLLRTMFGISVIPLVTIQSETYAPFRNDQDVHIAGTSVLSSQIMTNFLLTHAHSTILVTLANKLKDEDPENFQSLVRDLAKNIVTLVFDLSELQPEQDGSGQNGSDMPPCLPSTIAKISAHKFRSMVLEQKPRLVASLGEDVIELIEDEYRMFMAQYLSNSDFQRKVDKVRCFEKSWKWLNKTYPNLIMFLGGFASVFPGNPTVEGDFSIIAWTKPEYRRALKNVPLQGILHSKQKNQIKWLANWLAKQNEIAVDSDDE